MSMTEEGDTLTVKSEIFNIYTGEVLLTPGEKVEVTKVEYWSHTGRYSRIRGCEDIYNPLEIMSVKIDKYPSGSWKPEVFEDIIVK